MVIWSRFSKIDKSGAGGAPMIGFAITVYPRGIGLAIKIFDLLSSDGNGPEKGYFFMYLFESIFFRSTKRPTVKLSSLVNLIGFCC